MFIAKARGNRITGCPVACLWASSRVRQPCPQVQRVKVVKTKYWIRLL